MSVYLGNSGYVELQRRSGTGSKTSVVNPADINTTKRRFSFDFETGFLNSGDRIEISSTNGSLLEFIAASAWVVGVKQSAGSWYAHIDELGGIRLYTTFDGSLAGTLSDAIVLEDIVTDIPIEVKIENDVPNILAQCTYFELNTNREVVDTTVLGDEFRTQHSSLITGSGNFRAFWDYLPLFARNESGENAHYLLQLALRTEVGSEFSARFYLKGSNDATAGSASAANDLIWYQCDAVITQAGVNFSPDAAVEIVADFVTTGPIRLLAQTIAYSKVLQENTGEVLLEQDSTASLLQESLD